MKSPFVLYQCSYDAVRSAIESTAEADIFERRLMANGPIDTWLDADDRLVLLGDGENVVIWLWNYF